MLKKIFTISLLLALFAGNYSAHAQFDDYKVRAKAKKNKNSKMAEANFSENAQPPSMSLYSILDGGFKTVDLHSIAWPFHIDVAFLPAHDVNGKDLFGDNAQGAPLWVVVKNSSGEVMYKCAMNLANGLKPVTSTIKFDGVDPVYGDGKDNKYLWPAGRYTMEYTVTGKVIGSFPFEVVVGKNDDPYANKKEIRAIEGEYWNKYGCYNFEKGTGNFTFTTWETNHNMKFDGEEHQEEKMEYSAQIFYNGKPFSQPSKKTASMHRGSHERVWLTFHGANDKKSGPFLNQNDFKDGSYVIKATYNGKQREYPFQIKDGKPVPIAEQDRTKTTDPTKVIEGMNQYWFVKNTKA